MFSSLMNKANLIQQKPEAIKSDQDVIINKNSHSFNASDGKSALTRSELDSAELQSTSICFKTMKNTTQTAHMVFSMRGCLHSIMGKTERDREEKRGARGNVR